MFAKCVMTIDNENEMIENVYLREPYGLPFGYIYIYIYLYIYIYVYVYIYICIYIY